MGKKRVICDLNDDIPQSNVFVTDHHHHHRLQNHQKSMKIKSKDLHTLNSHLKKLAKSRYRKNFLPLRVPTLANLARENNTSTHNNGYHSLWLKHDRWGHWDDSSKGFDSYKNNVHHEDKGDDISGFQFNQCWNTTSLIGSENNVDLFDGDLFAPDLNASGNKVVMFEKEGLGYAPYVPDPVTNLDNSYEGRYLRDMLKLSSQEDMINEFVKGNLFDS
ncbi:hypothetical protein Tco_0174624 [Tanacetum coccineum]